MSGVVLISLAWLAIAGVPAIAAGRPVPPFADCQPESGRPWTYDRLMCLRQVGTAHQARDEVIRRLRQMGAGGLRHPWPTLVLAHVTLDQLYRDQAIVLYQTAAAGFAASGEAEGEVVARQNLANQYRLRGDSDAAGGQVASANAAAEASGQPLTIARAAVLDAVHAMATGGDIGNAHRVLLRADRLVSSSAPIGLRRTILFNLATASLYLGYLDAAIETLERYRALRLEDGSAQNAATAAFNLLTARVMRAERHPSPAARQRLIADAETVLAEAQSVGDPLIEARANQVLGDLRATDDRGRAAAHLQRCLDLESALRFPHLEARCLLSLARVESDHSPGRAHQLSDRAMSLLAADRDRVTLAYAWQSRLRLGWQLLPEDEAVAQSYEALAAIERLRTGETAERSRADLFGNWVGDYQWLTGRLLQAAPPRLAAAFEIGERLRARVLLERLAHGRVRTPADRDPLRQRVEERIAETQRQLMSVAPTAGERRSLLDRLRLLELERDDMDGRQRRARPVEAARPASLAAVQRHLGEREAMVWFSLAPWQDVYGEFGGGSWALTITRASVTVHRLAVRSSLGAAIAALNGQLRNRQSDPAVWAAATRSLGEELLGQALADIPSTMLRLVVVTDGPLHQLPFELLSVGGTPLLGERFEISEVPSATLWLQLRGSQASPPAARALVVADPDGLDGSPDGATRLARLPGARREARAIARALDLEPPQVALGPAASETLLKTAPLSATGILHLAAHARADAAFPERSAVFLAPGGADEDGWLQPAEIADLDLRGRLVVLSACDSAEGSLLPGEGPLSLARAFFAAGARAVVATRWPLRDDDAAMMMERFYEALAGGRSVAAAVQDARDAAIVTGLPAAAWAGLVVLGDGQQRPVAPHPDNGDAGLWMYALAILLAIGFFVIHREGAATR